MSSRLWFQSWLLFIICWCLWWPRTCTTTPVIYDYSSSEDLTADGTSHLTPLTQLWADDNEDRTMDSLIERVLPGAPLQHRVNRRSWRGNYKTHRKEKFKRRMSAGEFLQQLNEMMRDRNYVRGRLKGMRFGVSRKRSTSVNDWPLT